jgi:hypothetical protein
VRDRSGVGCKALAHQVEVGPPAGIEFGIDGLSEIGLAGALMGERQQPDHGAAGLLFGPVGKQRVEGAPIGLAREQLIAIDEIEQRHRLAAQGMDDVTVIDDVATLAVWLFVNFFQPSFKLAEKTREGAQVRKRHHPPARPCQLLLADPRTPAAVRDRVTALKTSLDPVRLLAEIRAAQQRLVALADKPMTGDAPAPTLEVFLAGLRTAWKEGAVRPTAQPAMMPVRWWRSRRDPFETTWPLLRQWFDAESERTGRELFERLQAEDPGVYPDGQLRTLQRRLKGWRREAARRLVFATALLHGSVAWRRGVDGIGGRALLIPDSYRAIQSEPRSPSSHSEAAAQSDELGRL